jgi:Flp pilus assembly protein TadG
MRRIHWRSDRGAAAVEFALVFPVLVLILFGIVEFGSIYNAQLMLTSAAREGARTMAVTGDPVAAKAAVLAASVGMSPALTAAEVSVSPSACAATSNVTVLLSYDKPYLTGLFGATVQLTGKATRLCNG